ncbi:MAG: cation:proton antiporter [Aeromicrobium sp.]
MTDLSVLLLAALGAGLAASLVRLPPLVGFLVAGFALNAAGVSPLEGLDVVADLGVALLLFGVGLTLDVRVLARREVWSTSLIHLGVTSALIWAYLSLIALVAASLLIETDWQSLLVVGFALSFSSTVLVIKVLDDRNATGSRFGRTAVGVLIIQDLVAVAFLTVARGEAPSPWAALLLLLLPAAWVARKVLRRLRHDELVPLFGVALALGPGYALFEQAGLKGDLGALIVGLLIASEPRSAELSKRLFSVKELLLVGFFLSIGFTGLPSVEDIVLAALLLLLIPLKSLGFVALLWWHGMRHRTSVQAGAVLGNYSEFGLIVAVVGASSDLLDPDWLVVLATAVAAGFLVSTLVNTQMSRLVALAERRLPQQSREQLHPGERAIDLAHADAVVLGMGRIGQAAYRQLENEYGLRVIGIEAREDRAAQLRSDDFEVIEGDALDPDLWHQLTQTGELDLAILAMPFHGANVAAMRLLEGQDFTGTIAAVAQRDREVDDMHGRAHSVFGLYSGAGTSLADGAAEAAGLSRRTDDA